VIPARDDLDAGREDFFGEARRDAKAGCGVLAVGDAEIDLALDDNVRQAIVDYFSSGRADDVTDKKNFHSKGPIFVELELAAVSEPSKQNGPLRRALLGPEPHE
jgi:hypothetical protein